ncbi:hypothetical protein MRX96_016002 [Rhipicephalus microplus]
MFVDTGAPANTASETSQGKMNYVVVEKIGKARCVMRHVKGKVQVQRRNPGKKVRVKGKEEGVPATFIREVSIHMAAQTRQRSASRVRCHDGV